MSTDPSLLLVLDYFKASLGVSLILLINVSSCVFGRHFYVNTKPLLCLMK